MNPADLLRPPEHVDVKAAGAYYTDSQIAEFLTWWAIRSGKERILDPCFGGGIFLRSASKRVQHLRGQPGESVFGVEIDPTVFQQISKRLSDEFFIPSKNFNEGDFFDVSNQNFGEFDAVVGNPPFIRYQRFKGEQRALALMRARHAGLELSQLSSSWAPFLAHSVGLIRKGGRLAMVLPSEIGHASYARPVIAFLSKSFAKCTFLTFRKRLFPELNTDTLLLLAEGKSQTCQGMYIKDFNHSGLLRSRIRVEDTIIRSKKRVDVKALTEGSRRLLEYVLPRKARDLYKELQMSPYTVCFQEIADVGIGYVTGANDFFHLDQSTARKHNIPNRFLKPAVCRSRALKGIQFTECDWREALENGSAAYLLLLNGEANLPPAVDSYLDYGKASGVSDTYKCRTRKPWYRVPHVYEADAFLTYMSGDQPRLVANASQAVAPNTLHVVRVKDPAITNGTELSIAWQSSICLLSAELEGHPLGGGMLKLEPREASNVLIPNIEMFQAKIDSLAEEVDLLVRSKNRSSALDFVDKRLLQDELGMSKSDCRILREAAEVLRHRRSSRGVTQIESN